MRTPKAGGRTASRGAPVRITSARTGHSADVHARQTRYLLSMGVRTACFLLAVVTTGWLRWVFIAAAFVLPYIAVVVANAGSAADPDGPGSFVDTSRRMLEPGPPPGSGDDGSQA
ncbi:MAG: DUF3099 domain-containing protein [Actinomycetota bacterium]|nr:DUF3099 domain-containing protein [Actinomycetota bacterium]